MLEELVGDHSLERFRVEYEKIHRALKKSHGKPLATSLSPRTSSSVLSISRAL